MPAPPQIAQLRDFSGGLNLRSDPFQLGPNESPDLLNMDVDPRGGVRTRRSVRQLFDADLAGEVHSLGEFHTSSGNHYLMAAHGTSVVSTTGTSWSAVKTRTVSDRNEFAQFKDLLYCVNGHTDKPFKWDGTTATNLNQSWNETLGTSTAGNMPYAKHVAVFQSHMFVADTNEGSTRYGSRVRFSHPNQPEDWRSADYFDVDPGTNGSIVAIVPFGDQLLIFKERGLYVLTGYGWESWTLNPMGGPGLVAPDAVAVTPHGVYFFAWPLGVYKWNGRSFEWMFERLAPAINLDILMSRRASVTAGWLNNRVWVSVPWGASDYRTFVLDPSLGSQGAWVAYDLDLGPMLSWESASSAYGCVAIRGANKSVCVVDQSAYTDKFSTTSGTLTISGYYTTPWVYGSTPANKKRWKKAHTTYWTDGSAEVEVEAFANFDGAATHRAYTDRFVTSAAGGNWGSNWGAFNWSGAGGAENFLLRGSSLGTAYALQLRFTGTAASTPWGVDSITIPFIPKPVR